MATQQCIQRWLRLFYVNYSTTSMARIKPPTDAHLAKLQDLLSVVKDIEQEVYDVTSMLSMKSNTVLNDKLASLKHLEDTSASVNNNGSMNLKKVKEKRVLIYGLDGSGVNVAETLCSMGVVNLILVGSRNKIERKDFASIGYKNKFENWTKAQACVHELMNKNVSANVEGCDLSVLTPGGGSMLKYALTNGTLFSFSDILTSENQYTILEKEEVFRCYFSTNKSIQANKNGINKSNVLDKEEDYRKITTKLSMAPMSVLVEKHRNAIDVLVANVTNTMETFILNDICLDLGVPLIVNYNGMLHGDIMIMHPSYSPCLRCNKTYTEFICNDSGDGASYPVALPSVQYIMSGIIINNCIRILLALNGKTNKENLVHFHYDFTNTKIIAVNYDEKGKECKNKKCRS
jgi:hypothetical protein